MAVLAFVAGVLNAIGFEAAGLFSANMTGNLSAMADHLGNGEVHVAARLALIVVLFVVGSVVAGLTINIGRQTKVQSVFALILWFEAGILVSMAGLPLLIQNADLGYVLVCGLGFSLGLQNAASSRLCTPSLRTTHISGVATDLGLAIAGLVTGTKDSAYGQDLIKLLGVTMIAFTVGGVLGAVLFPAYWVGAMVLCSGLLLWVSTRIRGQQSSGGPSETS